MGLTTVNGTTQLRDGSVTGAKSNGDFILADGSVAFAADQPMGSHKITGLANGVSANDAVNKSQLDAAVLGLLDFKGSTDASANPNYPSALKGDMYIVSVAGKIGGGSGKSVEVGDAYVASADNAGGTEASVGASWFVLEHNLVGALLTANNLSDLASTATALVNLGGTTAGIALFKLANPGAITFLRVNLDNSVTALDAASFRTAIGAIGGTLATRETPSGTVNGSNDTFTLAHTPTAGTEMVFVNGILQDAGSGNDYTISTVTITFLTGAIPQTGDKVRVTYWY